MLFLWVRLAERPNCLRDFDLFTECRFIVLIRWIFHIVIYTVFYNGNPLMEKRMKLNNNDRRSDIDRSLVRVTVSLNTVRWTRYCIKPPPLKETPPINRGGGVRY